MADYDRNLGEPGLNQPNLGEPGLNATTPDPAYRRRYAPNSPTTWIGGVVIALLIIFGLGYLFSGSTVNNGTAEHRAAATDSTAATPPAITPAPAPSDQAK